jgi:valyl-tRNA synthetase
MTNQEMPKNFDFKEAEPRLYQWWEENKWFKPEVAGEDAEPFVISIPPPNVTGILHIGHALFVSVEDIMIRYERMRGKAALWVPGTDHAGIATQLQVEKQLKAEGTSRQEVGYDEFVRRVWEWVGEKGTNITAQLRRMGASCDWDRERFTLDDNLSEAVQHVFITLYEQGLIYRGPRLVNWSPGLQTAVSDLEVERAEEAGKLYYFNYPVKDGGSIPVATTRPETIVGDTAVAVHPEDERYKHLIGKTALVPIINREIPIIADEYVDREVGTGALKVTPGHDPNDYEIGQRHSLPIISAMNKDATMNAKAGPYAGLDRFECRKQIWADMETAGMTIKVEDIIHAVPRSQRGGEIVEPMISTQWFLKIQPLADKALAAVRNGDIKIVPERFEKVYYHWLENIEDWCISRQLWWGHRIPAWHGPNGEIHIGKTAPEGEGWTPEEDVLDTWFSSGLWPFSTLGWPEKTADFERYYPTSVLETGHDILFFWVTRMIMMGLWFTDKPPFHTVYLHGLIRDKHGRKYSKSLGNTVDPIELVDQFGADPLRFTLLTSSTPGNDINLDTAKVEFTYKFVNKIWNITRLVHMNLDGDIPAGLPPVEALDLPSRWILSSLNRLLQRVQHLFDIYQYGEAGNQILSFMWDDFAPWYLEIAKHPLYNGTPEEKTQAQQVMVHVLDTCLRLLHPYMPYMTEEAWRYIPHEGETLMLAKWPQADEALISEAAENEMEVFMDLVRGIRNARADYNVDPGRRIKAVIAPGSHRDALGTYDYIFSRLCNVEQADLMEDNASAPEDSASVVIRDVTLYLPLAGLLDIAAECERLNKEREKIQQQITRAEAMLNNEQFVARAPEAVVAKERTQLAELQASLSQIDERISALCQS